MYTLRTKPQKLDSATPNEVGEPEVTPAMIGEGARVIRDVLYDIGPYSAKHLAEDVFKTMFAKLPASKTES
jgi:hypothetical protein